MRPERIRIDWLGNVNGSRRDYLICGPTKHDDYVVLLNGTRERYDSANVEIQRHADRPYEVFTHAMSEALYTRK